MREKCPLACGLCERVKWTTCTSDCYSNSPPGSLRRVGKQPRDAARSQLRHALPPKEAAHAELRRRLKALAPPSGRVRVRNAGGCLSPYTLEALDLQNITPTACTSTACSLFVLTLGVPALADEDQLSGGTADIILTHYPALSFEFTFSPAGSPSLETVDPARQSILNQGVNPIKIFLKNFPSAACTAATTCSDDDAGWMETNSETVDNDQGGQTTTTWNTKCEWVASNLDNLGQLCHTPMYGYAAVETVREKCPAACGICGCSDDAGWVETNSETVDNDQGGQTTTTWNTKCEWVASNLDNLGQLCNTPIHGYAAVETVREKCPAACGTCPLTCAQEARAGSLSVQFDDHFGEILSLADTNGMLQVTVLSPVTGIAGPSLVTLQVENSFQESITVTYNMIFVAPAPMVSPVDANMAGGSVHAISILGWAGRTFGVGDMQVLFGTVDGVVLSATTVDNPPRLDLTVKAPAVTQPGTYMGRIRTLDEEYSASFVFEYFKAPETVSIEPRRATLAGKTESSDGRSVSMVLKNFPSFSLASDVKITFGNTVCDDMNCGVLSVVPSLDKIHLKIRVPSMAVAGDVQLSVKYRGRSAPPLGGNPSMLYTRSEKSVSTTFTFFKPLPVVTSVKWCDVCNTGRVCLVMARCKDAAEPLEGKAPMITTEQGRLTVVVKNMPSMSFDPTTGSIADPSIVSLAIGNGFGLFKRVAFSEGATQGLEFSLPTVASVSNSPASLSIAPPSQASPSTVAFTCNRFDAEMKIACLTNCVGSSTDGGAEHLIATNIPLSSEIPLLDQVTITYGGRDVTSYSRSDILDVIDPDAALLYAGSEWTILKVVSPPFDGVITGGMSEAALEIRLKTSVTAGAVYNGFAYFAAPEIVSASMDASGTSIFVEFDQHTNRAEMSASTNNCGIILDQACIGQLGAGAACIWGSDRSLLILLGSDASVVPGPSSTIEIAVGILKSKNEVSGYSEAIAIVSAPQLAQAPAFSAMGPGTIDPCGDLEITTSYSSPRPLTFEWGCLNDEGLAQAIRTNTGQSLYLASGTAEMSEVDKEYQITIRATNFLGASSDLLVFTVLKKGSPAPVVMFDPPVLSVYRDEEVLITALVQFSRCPLPTGSIAFAWTQISGPEIDSAYFRSGAQFGLPTGTLLAGETYVIAAHISMAENPAVSSEKQYTITVLQRPLTARIAGGSMMNVASALPFSLDASMSQDPDVPTGAEAGLSFAWSCQIFEGPCLTTDGQLLILGTGFSLTVSGNTLSPTVGTPYLFTVEVSKRRKSARFSADAGLYRGGRASSRSCRVSVRDGPIGWISQGQRQQRVHACRIL